MGKKRKLNGLPNSLVQRYFSTMFYYKGGYMGDWIWKTARENNVTDIQIDVLNQTIIPKEIEIVPIVGFLYPLHETIEITLLKNNFPLNFITDVKFEIIVPKANELEHSLRCQATMTDIEGTNYKGKIYLEQTFEIPERKSLIRKIKDIFRKRIGSA